MADFVVQNQGWVTTERSNHGRHDTKVLRGQVLGSLLEAVDAKLGMTGTPVGTPDWAWVAMPDVDTTQPQYTEQQIDAVIEVDPNCAIVIGWIIQRQDGLDHPGTWRLGNVQRWQHAMWAIDALGEPGPLVQLGYRIDHNWESDSEPDYQDVEDHDLVWPAHFGIGMGGRQVRLPGETDTVLSVGSDLVVTGTPHDGFDLGSAALGDPNTQNGVMAYFEPGVSPAAGVLRFADGSQTAFTSPGTPLCQPVDLGGGTYWAWLTDTGVLQLATYQLGVGTTTAVLELPDFAPADATRQYTLSRLTFPAQSLFAVMRTTYDVDNDPLHFNADVIGCSFAGPRALTGWTRIRARTDEFRYPG